MLLLVASALAAPALRLPQGAHPVREAVDLRLDPAADTFTGVVDLVVHLDAAARQLRLNGKELKVGDASVSQGGRSWPASNRVVDAETLAFTWPKALSGEVTLHVEYAGKVTALDTQGVFRQREGDADYLLSQFEPLDARRAFPCFDDPQFKVPWQLTVHVPEGNGAWSNTSMETTGQDPDGWQWSRFHETRPLPSYLIAFAAGPFVSVEAGNAGAKHVPVRLVVPPGEVAHVAWALEQTAPILEALEAWFGEPYPYDKLDIVAIPQTVGFGAMENAGMVTVNLGTMAWNPVDDEVGRRRDYVETMAHELAHQWFGDLVTPMWWDDLWLNESFASWMETKITERLFPEWRVDVARVNGRASAMDVDGLTTSRRIHEPIVVVDDIETAFDGITYAKGEAVLTMFEAYMGPDAFRAGVRAYLAAHRDGSATSGDLVAALAGALPAADDAARAELAASFRSFIDQPGVPIVSAAIDCSGAPSVRLTQERFLPAAPPDGTRWTMPVCFTVGGGGPTEWYCAMLAEPTALVPLARTPVCPKTVTLNWDSRGYYRVAWAEPELRAVLQRSDLPLDARVAVVHDAAALVAAGRLPPTALLDEIEPMLRDAPPALIRATVGVVAGLADHLVPQALRPNYRRYILRVYGPLARELGLAAPAGEDPERRRLRAPLIGLVGTYGGDPALLEAARPLAEQWLIDRSGLDPELVVPVLSLAARNGNAALYTRVLEAALVERDRGRREELLAILGAFQDPAQLASSLELVRSGQVDVRDALGLVFTPLSMPATRAAQWSLLTNDLDAFARLVPIYARGYLPYMGSVWCDAGRRAEVESLFGRRAKRWIGGPHALAQTLETIDVCIASTASQRPGVTAWLERQ
ncbi:aminopeptidase [Deltaproteobacteria bacterium]|nr:aminopeptidase [Deltaproteobacteria bacterium]